MSVVLDETEPAWRANQGVASVDWSIHGTMTDEPCIPVKAHDNSLDTSTILRAGTFCEQLVDLFFCGVET